MKYCSRCGAELVDEAVVCTKCGCAVGQIVVKTSEIGKKFVIGLVELILGIVGMVYSILAITVYSDEVYWWGDLSNFGKLTLAIFMISKVVVTDGWSRLATKKIHTICAFVIPWFIFLYVIMAYMIIPSTRW